MNYEQLYAYLDTRPIEEIKECMDNVVKLVRSHTPESQQSEVFSSLQSKKNDMETSAGIQSTMHRLQVAQRVWTQHAVWNKFGTNSEQHQCAQDLALATAHLFTDKEVAQYILNITDQIEAKSRDTRGETSTHSAAQTGLGSNSTSGTKRPRVESVPSPSNVVSLIDNSSSEISGAEVPDFTDELTQRRQQEIKRQRHGGGRESAWDKNAVILARHRVYVNCLTLVSFPGFCVGSCGCSV